MDKMKKLKVVLLEPHKAARITEIDASLQGCQEAVGGYIEAISPFQDDVCMVCNEEGRINGMPPNRSIYTANGERSQIIFGPAFICGSGIEDFESLTDEQAERYKRMFFYPEIFILETGDKIAAIKFNEDSGNVVWIPAGEEH